MRGLVLALLAGALLVTAQRWGSFVAGGSDSSCYLLQAELWAGLLAHPGTATVQPAEPLALAAPWPAADATFAPTGHVASAVVPGAFVPICPSGLSILMAPLRLLGGRPAMFLLVPVFGALLVLGAYAIGSRYGDQVGMAAALLTAASPIVLYQVVQPMSDVPAAALWTLAIAEATGSKPKHAWLAGLATSLAILVRPNLLPLGVVLGLFLLLRPERSWPRRLGDAARFAAACVPGCLAVALIHQTFYGSPLASGYGSLDALFSTAHVGPNAACYARWLWESHTPVVFLALAAPLLLPGPITTLLLALVAADLAVYLPYVVFEDWSYLRFLLPVIPLLIVLAVASLDALLRRFHLRRPGPVLAAVALALAVVFVMRAVERNAFRLQAYEARFERAGAFVASRLPANALVVTSYESASVRFYAGRKTLTWDALDPAWLDGALAWARAQGLEPFLLFERREEPDFRRRFAGTPIGALDWPPMAEVAAQVRIYRPQDRADYLAGRGRPTEYAR